MRARRVGDRSEFRLFQNEREIGHVTGSAVRLHGFATRDDATAGATLASRALSRRRKALTMTCGSARLLKLLTPQPAAMSTSAGSTTIQEAW